MTDWDNNTSAPVGDFDWNGGATGGGDSGFAGEDYNGISNEHVSKYEGTGGGACHNCGQEGHMKRDCPEPSTNSGECYNCGEVGHNKADCTNPAVERAFVGACRSCGQEGHRAADCTQAFCKKCGNQGHTNSKCEGRYNIYPAKLPEIVDPDMAWDNLVQADMTRDVGEFKQAFWVYCKLCPELTLAQIENSFRQQGFVTYIVAMEREAVSDVHTNVDLQGTVDHKFVVTFQHSQVPRRKINAQAWPKSAEENLERLNDAGFPMDRMVPKCNNCGLIGHIRKDCPEEAVEIEKLEPTCRNCNETGHYIRDCTATRVDRNACRNCGESGHNSKECPEPRKAGDDVQCNHCNEMGHFSRDCPTKPKMACRNCQEEGHKAAECTNERVFVCRNCEKIGHAARDCPEPKNMATVQCRNCENMGHFSKECPEPKDWSKVQCRNCNEFGHGTGRCPNPTASAVEEAAPFSEAAAGDTDYTAIAATGDWNATPAVEAETAPVDNSAWAGASSTDAVEAW